MNWTHTISLQPDFDIWSTFHRSTKICHQKIPFINLLGQTSYVSDSQVFFKMLSHPEAMYLYNSGSMTAIERGTPSRKCELFLHNAPSRHRRCSNVGNILGVFCQPLSSDHLSVIQVSHKDNSSNLKPTKTLSKSKQKIDSTEHVERQIRTEHTREQVLNWCGSHATT